MSQINLKSISGITSITTPAGVDNVFTVHSNDTTERFRVDQSGNQNISGIVTASNFKRANGDSCTIRYGGCDGVHWGRGTGYGNEYFDRLGGSVAGVANCSSDEYLKGFGIGRCNSGRGLRLKMNCCKR